MTPRLTHDDDGRVLACPNCDAAGRCYRRTGSDTPIEQTIRCQECGHTCRPDDLIDRENRIDPQRAAKHAGLPGESMAKTLHDASPDAVGGAE